MTGKNDKLLKQDFIDSFMINYRSAGDKVPYERTAYCKPYTVIETRANYKVSAGGVTKRFSNLYAVGCFIYDRTFDLKKTYIKPITQAKQLRQIKYEYQLFVHSKSYKEHLAYQNNA